MVKIKDLQLKIVELIIQSHTSENPQAQDADLSLWVLYIGGKPIWVSVWKYFCNHIIKYGWMAIISNLPLMHMGVSLSHWIVVNVILFWWFFSKLKCYFISSLSICLSFHCSSVLWLYSFRFSPISPVLLYSSLFLLSLCQTTCGFLQLSHCHVITKVRCSRNGEHGTQRQGHCSGLQKDLGLGWPGPVFLCSLTHEPLHTLGPGISQAPRAK